MAVLLVAAMYRRVDLWLVEAAESEAHPHPVGEMVETPVVLVGEAWLAASVGRGHI